eukprot:gene27829-33982_t
MTFAHLFLLALLGNVSAASFGAFKLEPWGSNGIRVRVSPPGSTAITEPITPALLPAAPPGTTGDAITGFCTGDQQQQEEQPSPATVTNGNLKVNIDSSSGFVTVTRVSDGTVLLKQTDLVWGTPSKQQARRPGSVTAQVSFQPLDDDEFVYGLGEHKNKRV